MIALIPLFLVLLVIFATIVLGIAATRKAQTASDFFVAGRQVGIFMNASAISGEYLSAASFMGIAGLVMKVGYDALWYPVGYAAGYLFLLLFIAGPLRRFGAYTIPDFAEGRFNSPVFRKIAVVFVLLIGFFYTMPQMKAAGVTVALIMGWPYWAGIVIVGSVITFNVVLGGMKGITFVQAFQYWVKLFAISVPLFVLMAVFGGYSGLLGAMNAAPHDAPKFAKETTVNVAGKDKAPANVVSLSTLAPTKITFGEGAIIEKVSSSAKLKPGEKPSFFLRDGGIGDGISTDIHNARASGILVGYPFRALNADESENPEGTPNAPKFEMAVASDLTFEGGAYVPNTSAHQKWLAPFGTLTSKHGYPLLYTYSLLIALVCGTAGLPHILVRFYTNPDGRAAKRTTFWVMVLLGAFYVFTPVWGTLGRALLPALYANNKTDTVVIALPALLQSELLGKILVGVTSAGAFAAFMSTFSGLLVSMSGAFAHDIYGKILRPDASPASRLMAFKIAAIGVGAVSMGLGLLVEPFDIALLVGWAFAIAAASYFPLLLLGAWWRGLTVAGAASGMLIGGTLSLLAIATFMAISLKVIVLDLPPLALSLMEQPAIWGVPLSLAIMGMVSRLTARSVPPDVSLKMLRLHAPEALGLSQNYVE